jgi:hypothetical protein
VSLQRLLILLLCLPVLGVLFGRDFLGLLSDLVPGLLELIVFEVYYFLEAIRLLRVTVARKGIQDFG